MSTDHATHATADGPAPLVSIGLPLYNCAQWLEPTLQSILAQTLRDFELILSDNASTDGTYALAQSYAGRDARIRLHRQEANIGAPANYRFVAHQARGRYFKWQASSDLISPNYLADCVQTLESSPEAVLCYGHTRIFSETPEDGRDYDDNVDLRMPDPVARYEGVLDRLSLNNAINGLIRRETLLTTPIMPNYYSCDNVVLAELAILGHIVQRPSATFYRRMHVQTATRLKSEEETRRHYYPKSRPGMLFQQWQLCLGYLSAVRRAPVTFAQRRRLFVRTLKLCYWNAPRLWGDVVHAGRFLVGGRA